MYQPDVLRAQPNRAATRVVLILDVPAGPEELHRRAAQLAGEFGQLVAHSIPGVRARNSVLPAGADPARSHPHRPVTRGLHIDAVGRRVLIDGQPVGLTYREFELIAYLSARAGKVVSRAELMRTVWVDLGQEPANCRTVDTHVRRLRTKLGAHADSLTTVRGSGYRFDPSPLPFAPARRLGA